MTGYTDNNGTGAHAVTVGGVTLAFGADGVLWDPSAAEINAMTATDGRRVRFTAVTSLAKSAEIAAAVEEPEIFSTMVMGGELPAGDEPEELPSALSGKRRRRKSGSE